MSENTNDSINQPTSDLTVKAADAPTPLAVPAKTVKIISPRPPGSPPIPVPAAALPKHRNENDKSSDQMNATTGDGSVESNGEEAEPMPVMTPEQLARTLFVGNLPFFVNNEDLSQIFSEIGAVKAAKVVAFRNGRSKGFGFVEMESEALAKAAIEKFNEGKLFDRIVVVKEAKAPEPRAPRPPKSPRQGDSASGPEQGRRRPRPRHARGPRSGGGRNFGETRPNPVLSNASNSATQDANLNSQSESNQDPLLPKPDPYSSLPEPPEVG